MLVSRHGHTWPPVQPWENLADQLLLPLALAGGALFANVSGAWEARGGLKREVSPIQRTIVPVANTLASTEENLRIMKIITAY
jgi:hypothetical protein